MENSHIDKIVGIPDEHQEDYKKYAQEATDTFGIEKQENEIEKTERDIEIINFAKQVVDEYVSEYGMDRIKEVPLEKIHLLKEGGTEDLSEGGADISGGAHTAFEGSINVDRSKSDIQFALIVFHELIHAKSYVAMQKAANENGHFIPYRQGFEIITRDGKTIYFNDFNEGVVGILTKRFYFEKIIDNQLFKNDEMQPELSRQSEIDGIHFLVDEIYNKHSDTYKSKEEVLNAIITAGVTGKLLTIARMVEDTFGKGTFRELAEGGKIEIKNNNE